MQAQLITLLLAGSALATTTATAAYAAPTSNLDNFSNGENITLAGTVYQKSDSQFTLDASGSMINVDTKNLQWEPGENIALGDKIVVNGSVDKLSANNSEIDADKLYRAQDYSYYYVIDTREAPATMTGYGYNGANAAPQGINPQPASQNYSTIQGNSNSNVQLSGIVSDISNQQFSIATDNGQTMLISTDALGFDPLSGSYALRPGDRVMVNGTMVQQGYGYNQGAMIKADNVVEIDAPQTLQHPNAAYGM